MGIFRRAGVPDAELATLKQFTRETADVQLGRNMAPFTALNRQIATSSGGHSLSSIWNLLSASGLTSNCRPDRLGSV